MRILVLKMRHLALGLLLTAMLAGCARSYFDEPVAAEETCTPGILQCRGDKVQHCPHGMWQTLDDCALFDMVCSSETGRVGCVETVDTEQDGGVADGGPEDARE